MNSAADVIRFLEANVILESGKPIRFEPWQRANVLEPMFTKVDGRRRWNIFLNGTAKKNGKSTLGACVAVYALLLDDANPEVYSCAGDLDQARIIFQFTKKIIERSPTLRPLFRFHKDTIERRDGSGIYRALSADASGTHGFSPSAVLWDELWNQPSYDLWEALTLIPTRADPFHMVNTYSGFQARPGNLLWDLYSAGMAGEDPDMHMFWLSGKDANPASWITARYLESQRRRLPDHIFRRLHLNEWSVAEDSKVFNIPAECWAGTFEDPVPSATYACGIDLAKFRDFSAWAIIRTDTTPRRVVELGKLPHMDYTRQVEILAAKVARFGRPRAVVDSGAAGTAIIELMQKVGMSVEEFRFTNESKAKVVTDLVIAFEQRRLMLPKSERTLEENRAIADLETELFNFAPEVLRSGAIRYAAGGSYHDDLVMALCLAYSESETVEPVFWCFQAGARNTDGPDRFWKDVRDF